MENLNFNDLKRLVEAKNTQVKRSPNFIKIKLLEDDFIEAKIPYKTTIEFNQLDNEISKIGPHGHSIQDYCLAWDLIERKPRLLVINKKIGKKLYLQDCPEYLQSIVVNNSQNLTSALGQLASSSKKQLDAKLMDDEQETSKTELS